MSPKNSDVRAQGEKVDHSRTIVTEIPERNFVLFDRPSYIYIYMCVCVCVCAVREGEREFTIHLMIGDVKLEVVSYYPALILNCLYIYIYIRVCVYRCVYVCVREREGGEKESEREREGGEKESERERGGRERE